VIPARRPVVVALVASFVLHTLGILRVWHDWDTFSRDPVVAWIDFPISLAYLHLNGWQVLLCSLLLGGLQWALAGALLTALIGRSARSGSGKVE
jgi:hypothetical protein